MFQRNNKSRTKIKILPMIDVLFFLLVFFMLFTTFRTTPAGLDIDLPQAETVTEQKQEQLMVNVSANGQIYVDDQLLTKTDLKNEVATVIEQNPKAVVIIKADRAVAYDEVVEVMDIARQVGASKLALAADNKVDQK
ncbi:ExbD/TolR family protein [Acetohalobium arabaticum]|uniref:Biopolymer transport protein ExbD/TolR n=1 Tax=Acetohalobium arabaticum (strain ATCC 49924 / DSM 5501 / Z-7288) TaxID=574087 RepID=D9QR36_ACEAZ|nr:biopolymer transporter ExbD [Acetohalobium arabaticum]ADL12977.1 Biopolymer transport protein ExbD/TolR [Acetohalobium arabaticum DSM 5501]